jgi:NAD(P)-dependent dehydrogenase (short-subunit alcohol dehydrogenase family)
MLSSRKADDLEQAVAELQAAGIDARWIAADCAKEADIRRLADETLQRMGAMWTSWSTTPAPPGARRPKTTRWTPGTR